MSRTAAPADTGEVVVTPEVLTAPEVRHASLIDMMRDKLAAEPKVDVKILNADSDVFVQINGYSFLIQPKVKVRVPKSVALLLEQGGYI
jgi:hypothetical protein